MVYSLHQNDMIEKLNILGSSHEEIALSLKKLGIKGYVRSVCNCPLANYYKSLGYKHVSVGGDGFLIDGIDFIHTKASEDFLFMFDTNQYPELRIEL